MNKRGLGKGLSALIPENSEIMDKAVAEIKITEIEANEKQPRKFFNDEALKELAASIKEHGVVQPIIVRKVGSGYQIVAGERRWRAARLAGLKTIPAVVKDYTEMQVMEIALIENLQREDLNPIEEALAYKALMEEYNMTQEEIAVKLGKGRPTIANSLRLIGLPESIKKLIVEEKISAGHARAILTVGSEAMQLQIAERIVNEQLSVRQVEKLVSEDKREKKEKSTRQKNIEVIELEEKIKNLLGTKVNITYKKGRGKIEIEYYSDEDLERILELLQK